MMNIFFKKNAPILLVLLGIFLLFFMGQPIPAGICFLIGIVMIIDKIWPEEWGQKLINNN